MSDILTADGKFLEQHVTDVGCLPLKRSYYNFPREVPDQDDWETWISYMKVITNQNFELPTPLGGWMCSTHRRWEWILNDSDQILYRRRGDSSEVYMNLNGRWVKEGLKKWNLKGKLRQLDFRGLEGSQ